MRVWDRKGKLEREREREKKRVRVTNFLRAM